MGTSASKQTVVTARAASGGDRFRGRIGELLEVAGIRIDGPNPWDVQVHDDRVYARVLGEASIGLGETYMDGWWDCEALDEFFYRILEADLPAHIKPISDIFWVLKAKLFNLQRPSRAYEVGRHHYDIGNDLYESMLDGRMIYSCAYWENAQDLDEAQEAKLDLVCRKLGLRPGMKLLDIGCGWGGTAQFAAERYGVDVVGITVSEEQASYARDKCQGLPIEIVLQDYRDVTGIFDRILSIGMFEHVGPKNHRKYMDVVRRCLRPDGLFLLHTIGENKTIGRVNPWFEKYIFPNSVAPSATQIGKSVEGVFVIEDWQNIGAHYERTLLTWYANFEKNWDSIKEGYSERIYRMWRFYLLSCAGYLRGRRKQVWQIILSPKGIPGGYGAIR